jgi:hypothetical protein
MRRPLLVLLAAALLAPASASAAAPIMALAQVQPGMRCTALSVVRGTAITSFDVDVLDVIDRQDPVAAQILIKVSGPAVDATGIGPGFSGSPIYCPDAAGTSRDVGAISAGIGQYGGTVGLATPIEAILAEPVLPPSSAARAVRRSAVAGSYSLASPLTLSGVSPAIGELFARASRRAGRPLLTTAASPREVGYPPQPLVPGAAVSVGLTSGDVGIGAIGTVAYADGSDVWIFGHALDGAGRRALFLQDAYIQTVVSNPLGTEDLTTYKLGSPGNDEGTVSNDTLNAVVGRLGALPPHYPMTVTARDLDTGRVRSLTTLVADEGDVGAPVGPSVLGIAGASAVAEAGTSVLGGSPARQRGEMCVAITLRELRRPLRFCQHYAVDAAGPNALAGTLATDFSDAASLIDGYPFGVLHPAKVEVGIRLRRGLRQAYLEDATAVTQVRRGHAVKLRLRLRRTQTGARFTRTIELHIPRATTTGRHTIDLQGTDADAGTNPDDTDDLTAVFGDGGTPAGQPPQTLGELRERVEGLERYTGVTASIGRSATDAYEDPNLRISGETSVVVTIRR